MEYDYKKIDKDPITYVSKLKTKELEDLLRHLSNEYYNTEKSMVTDKTFDAIKEYLEEKSPKSKFLKEIGAPPKSQEKVKLPFPMMSLDKVKDEDALNKFIKKYHGPYVISDKLDGVSAMLYNGKLYSRGDGKTGQDISNLIKYTIKNTTMPPNMAIRGELILTKHDFETIKDKMTNPRNGVAGLVNAKHPDPIILALIKFVAYGIMYPEFTQEEQFELLEKMKFTTSTHITVTKKEISNEFLTKYLTTRKKKSDYEIDGIVISDSSDSYKISADNPDYAVAYKMLSETFDVTVEDVVWEASQYGYLKPRIIIKPLKTQGVTITHATAFNAKYVLDNKLGPGSIVKITRSGDVIPYILEVVKSTKAKMPDMEYAWNTTKVDIIVNDIFMNASTGIKVKQLDSFFSTLGVKYISEGILKKLVDAGFDTVFKILNADKKKLTAIDGIGDKLIEKIYNNIDTQLKTTKMAKLMDASGIFGRGLGERKLVLITNKYPDVMEIKLDKKEFIEKLNEIDGFSTLTSTRFVDNLPKFKIYFAELGKFIDLSYLTKINLILVPKGKLFENEIVVFTGFRNADYEKLIETNGGKISSSVSGKTTLLVYTDCAGGSKLTKAKELGIKTLTKEEFEKLYIK